MDIKPIQHQPQQFQQQQQQLQHQQLQQQQHQQLQLQPQQMHVLFEFSSLDGREDIDEKTQKSYNNLKQMIANKSAKECHDIYNKYIQLNPQQNTEELTMGLLVAILVEQDNQQSRYYRDIVTFSKDCLNLFSTYLNMIIIERLHKLRDHAIKQIFWITNQLMKASINTAENISSNLIRQIAGGDLSTKNLKLIENLLDLFVENRSWLINSTNFMVPTIIYTFMRLLADHMMPPQSLLKQKEVDFVIGLIREKFNECLHIGRDFLRLLHNIVKIPEFEKLWHDIYNNPKSLHPTFQNPLNLLTYRTPRRLIQSRLTFEMEKKISFLATQVKFGNQKRYQNWFHKQYLSTPESLSLRCDLIRYICTIIHPSNEVLCSDIIPRWAIIGWLLTTCTSNSSALNSKLTLFFDWLLYDPKADNIMNIEPAILVMYYSISSHPNVTASLLDFLCRIPVTFSPKLAEPIKAGLKKSLQQILEKRVVPTLAPLFDNPKHDQALKALIKETFPEFCANATPVITSLPPIHLDNGVPSTNPIVTAQTTANAIGIQFNNHHNINTATVATSSTTSPLMPNSTNPLTKSADIQEKIVLNSASDAFTNQLSYDPLSNQRVQNDTDVIITNHLHNSNRTNDLHHHSQPCGDKLDSISGPASSVTRDEVKAFSWNGTENVNVSYSHKQQNHDNKNRKSSLSSSSTSSDLISSASLPLPSTKKLKTSVCSGSGGGGSSNAASTENLIGNDSSKNITSKLASCASIINYSTESMSSLDLIHDQASNVKVIYPFLSVQAPNLKEVLNSFDEPIRVILEDLSIERCSETRCNLMDRLISTVFDNSEQSTSSTMKNLGHCLAYFAVDDFATRIFPSKSSQDIKLLEDSIATPFFVLCRSAFSNNRPSWTVRPMSLLAAIGKFMEATGFLILYFLKGNLSARFFQDRNFTCSPFKTKTNLKYPLHEPKKLIVTAIISGSSVSTGYIDFCTTAKRKFSKCLYDDLYMALTYDSEMFCFLLPSVFGELAASGAFTITGNVDLIRLVVSAIDPVNLQELICLCLTGSTKVINKEEVTQLIESSLNWESWEQYCVWRLICAQSVPIENYINILPKLDTKANAEAMSSILLNLQKVSEPTINMIQQLINCDCKPNDPFVSSILRYWSMKTDTKDLAKSISSLFNSRPSSPQTKRKGQTKSTASSKNSSSLSPFNEKILQHLDSIRQRAPKNKLLAQKEIIDMLNQLETLCNDNQRKKFADLFSNRSKASNKIR